MRKFPRHIISNGIYLAIILGVTIWLTMSSSQKQDSCPDGYLAVPGDEPFCIMRFEAQRNPETGKAESKLGAFPWNFQSPVEAKDACEELGAGYQLTTSEQWMRIAENIATTTINDLSNEDNLQLGVGNSAGQKRVLAAPERNASLDNCNLSFPLSDTTNQNCGLRNMGSFTGAAGNWNEPYIPGEPGRSMMRNHTLSNGEVIWDFTGNLWEWMGDRFIFEDKTGSGDSFPTDSDGLTGNGIIAKFPITETRWIEHSEVASYGNLSRTKPQRNGLDSRNGIGTISLNPGWSWDDASNNTSPFKAVARGGAWANNANSGIYSTNLALGPSYNRNYTGFRCTKTLK